MSRKPRLSPSGPVLTDVGSFMTDKIPVVIDASDTGPVAQVFTLATQAEAGSFSKVMVNGWASIFMSADETGSPSPSDGTILMEVSWDNGATYQAATPRLWTGGGPQNPNTFPTPLFAQDSAGPASGNVLLRITFFGEPVGGSEALVITLTGEVAAIFS